jgi:hypothetical protein
MTDKIDNLLALLAKSKFRSSFNLKSKDIEYVKQRGLNVIQQHTRDFIIKRLAAAEPKNDGKQTPMKGHPVFIAQHATATCCRKCLLKWHKIPMHKPLNKSEIDYIMLVIIAWIKANIPKFAD